jgi:CRISPR-associated endonuclease/helicase Cas3
MLYAHTPREGSDEWHGLEEHLRAVSELAAEHAEAFGAAELGRWVGAYHDVGKASPAFQAYLQMCHLEPDRKHKTTDHKGAGTWAAGNALPPLAFIINGHHGGLQDFGTLRRIFKELESDPARIDAYRAMEAALGEVLDVEFGGLPPWTESPRSRELFIRMLFSALVDADHRDTEQHKEPDAAAQRGHGLDLRELASRLSDAQRALSGRRDDPVNAVRDEVYQACLKAAEWEPGFFRMTVPTGGGKTRSGLAFALEHALRHGLRRVIVTVPYLTITDQTVKVYHDILGDEHAVLEHHSAANWREDPAGAQTGDALWQRLAAQDWDAPVIVTTTVQLIESLFGRTPTACRKLHRIARSVIILDEVQTLPPPLLEPILDVLRELVAHYGVSVVLSTATQPALDDAPGFAGLPNVREVAPDPPRLFKVLKRVAYQWPDKHETPWSWVRVAEEMRLEPRAMAIVNTKANALALLDALDDPDAFHLSTLLCGAHRRDVLAVIRARLAAGRPCRLVSTQVVEAGVDLDFPLVLRAMGPLDRIVQAAGRCNREGRLPGLGRVIVFQPEDGGMPSDDYRTGTGITQALLDEGLANPTDPDTFRRYFARLFRMVALDSKSVQDLRERLAYEQVAHRCRLIEDDSVSVLVTYKRPERFLDDLRGDPALLARHHGEESERLIAELERQRDRPRPGQARDLLRKAQPYIVSVKARSIGDAVEQGWAIELLGDVWQWEGRRYDDVRGLMWRAREADAFVVGG